jgi:hypothetical protein
MDAHASWQLAAVDDLPSAFICRRLDTRQKNCLSSALLCQVHDARQKVFLPSVFFVESTTLTKLSLCRKLFFFLVPIVLLSAKLYPLSKEHVCLS